MAQTAPIDAYLGANRTGLAIGATLYQLDGSTSHAAFSTTGWYEAPAGSGAWHHAGLSLPDAGGVIAVGVSGTEYMRVAVPARQLLYSEYTAPASAAQIRTEIDSNSTQLAKIGTPVGASVSADIAAIKTETASIQTVTDALPDSGALTTITNNVAFILADTGTDGVVVATASKTGYALSSAGVQAIWEYGTRTLTGFGTLVADVWAYATRTLTSFGSIAGAVATVTGGNIVVYARDTWQFSITNSSLALSDYEVVAFVVKSYDGHSDNDAILYVRSDTGLVRIGGAAGSSGDGSLTVDSNTQITVNIALAVTGVAPGTYTWWIKGINTSPSPTTGFTVATGRITVYSAGLQAIG